MKIVNGIAEDGTDYTKDMSDSYVRLHYSALSKTRRHGDPGFKIPVATGPRRRLADFIIDNTQAAELSRYACNEARRGNRAEAQRAQEVINSIFQKMGSQKHQVQQAA